ncbi:hypothetical protein ILT44_29590 [Microvirga sp. BT689]|nr:hypothetical protein [Microvirga arvi]MBM6584352.1 hypothetical protein [Microvirga arvi]
MANEIAWGHIFPVTIPFKSDYKLQLEAVMDRALKNRPKLPDVGLKSAA